MTSSTQPMMVEDSNLSRAWARTFLHVLDNPGAAISPLVVTLTGFTPEGDAVEDASVRAALDACLSTNGRYDVETVAWTIFPRSMLRIAKGDRHRLFELYRGSYPRFRALNPSANGRGLYFGRLVAYERGPCDGNQLEWILLQYGARSGVRQTMLQASIFDPEHDHVASAQLGFPCLQHVTFVPEGDELVANAFYATQQLFDKAYGNWLGLCELGRFMAGEMGLRLARLNCFVGVEKFQRITKGAASLRPLIAAARACVGDGAAGGVPTGHGPA